MYASIRSLVGDELTLHEDMAEEAFEIRHGDEAVAWLGDPRFNGVTSAMSRDGEWTFTRLRGGSSDASRGGFVVARYRSGLLPGGTLTLGEDVRFRLRARGRRRHVSRGPRERVVTVDFSHSPRRITFGEAAQGIHDLALLTLFSIHAMLVESDVPSGGGATGYGGP